MYASLTNYLRNRTNCIQLDHLCSEAVAVHKEVPQGSVLGHLLFIIALMALI